MIVIKDSGISEEFQPTKLIRVLTQACKNTNIDPIDLFEEILPHIESGMTSKAIQRIAVKHTADRISPETPDYQYISARLEMYLLRKEVYGHYQPWSLSYIIEKRVKSGIYDPQLMDKWSKSEIEYLDSKIDHERDMNFAYAGVMQFKSKYLVQDRSTEEIFETPQFSYILIAMCLHQEEKTDRLEKVLKFYNAASRQKISLPTPIMAGVRTPTRQFSSCCKIESGDSLESINATSDAVVKYISKRAGIGVNGGSIRAEGSRIRSGEIKHTGVIPFWKHFHTAVKSCSQGGVRGGSATMNFPIWHLEAEKLLVLKNNKGVEENRIRQLDYVVQFNTLMFERLRDNGFITLFSPHVADGKLYDYFFSDSVKFKELYAKLESDPTVVKKRIKATELIASFVQERTGTGRLYPMFVDNVNNHGPYKEPIRQTNLCVEIFQPTTPMATKSLHKKTFSSELEAINGVSGLSETELAIDTYPLFNENSNKTEYVLEYEEDDSEIALCSLAAYNLGAIDSIDELEELAEIAVRALDNMLDYQDYPHLAALKAKKRRALGIGITNYAYFLAKNFVKYSDGSANFLTHKWMEAIQYYNIKASVKLAKEFGPCEYFKRTRYADGELPIDWYNKNVDKLIKNKLFMDWEQIRTDILTFGMRNSVLSAFMPCESSSQISNSTNGIEPPRQLVSTKQSKDGVFNQVVPEIDLLSGEYETAWKMAEHSNRGYMTLVAIMQKFNDQGISSNNYYDPARYNDNQLPMEVVIGDITFANHYGFKSIYYSNMRDGADGSEQGEACEGGGCSV